MPRKPSASTRNPHPRGSNRDAFDRRDLLYHPALVSLPAEWMPRWDWLVILDQGSQGACTGFGLAAVINYQLAARLDRKPDRAKERVSPRMLYVMAKRYDQWAGDSYGWSSARGAMKGWFKNGVCSEWRWPSAFDAEGKPAEPDRLTEARRTEAPRVPLGAYYRVLPRRSDVHAALFEAGVVYAVADTHPGWDRARHQIPFEPGARGGGGHAFAIIGYTPEGFLVQNSWGEDWGSYRDDEGQEHPGVSLWTYPDFDQNVWDLWVARIALPVESLTALATAGRRASIYAAREPKYSAPPADIHGRYVHLDGTSYVNEGDYPTQGEEIPELLQAWVGPARPGGPLLLHFPGGLSPLCASALRVERWHPILAANGISDLHFLWETGLLDEMRDILTGKHAFVETRVSTASSWWDDWFEKAAQPLGHALWKAMRMDARDAFTQDSFSGKTGSGSHFAACLSQTLKQSPRPLHLLCQSAGSIWTGHFLDAWSRMDGPPIASLTAFAPACTVEFFLEHYAPHLQSGLVESFHLFQLTDQAEQDDTVARLYRKSMLYLISRSFQEKGRVAPLLGMERYWESLAKTLATMDLLQRIHRTLAQPSSGICEATTHTGFDHDAPTLNTLIQTCLGTSPLRPFTKMEARG